MPRASNRVLTALTARLEHRRPELEQAALGRVRAADPAVESDPVYRDALSAAQAAAFDYRFEAVTTLGGELKPVPVQVLSQARLAARIGVSLDTELRRYCAANTLLGDVLIEEAECLELPKPEFRQLLRAQATCFDRLFTAVSEEYEREAKVRIKTGNEHRAELVERLLKGEILDAAGLRYELESWHLGVVATGPDASGAVRAVAATLDRTLLLVGRQGGASWAWIGGRHKHDDDELEHLGSYESSDLIKLAVGEPAYGLSGWRLTHRQAVAALPVALRGKKDFVRYADVALIASILNDDVLVASLRQLYLAPMRQDRDGGARALQTLRAYFAAERNISSAAAALGVNRNTVAARLQSIEKRIGCRISSCTADVEAALCLDELSY